jgi:DNA transformation protein and related proteins
MAASSALLDYLLDQLGSLGQARGRAMFGGHGLYLDGLFIGIIDDETLYLKADEASRPDFEAAGMEPFTYASRGRRIALSFWQAPADVIEDPLELQRWVAAAVRARTTPRQRKSDR